MRRTTYTRHTRRRNRCYCCGRYFDAVRETATWCSPRCRQIVTRRKAEGPPFPERYCWAKPVHGLQQLGNINRAGEVTAYNVGAPGSCWKCGGTGHECARCGAVLLDACKCPGGGNWLDCADCEGSGLERPPATAATSAVDQLAEGARDCSPADRCKICDGRGWECALCKLGAKNCRCKVASSRLCQCCNGTGHWTGQLRPPAARTVADQVEADRRFAQSAEIQARLKQEEAKLAAAEALYGKAPPREVQKPPRPRRTPASSKPSPAKEKKGAAPGPQPPTPPPPQKARRSRRIAR